MTQDGKTIAACLAGMTVSLLLVGLISGTFGRHVIQVAPALVALGATTRQRRWGPYAAIPIFAVWLLLMSLIWLYLAGVATFFDGAFSPAEVLLTVFVGLCSVIGLFASLRHKPTTGIGNRVLVVVLFAGLQIGAMWMSFLEPFANR